MIKALFTFRIISFTFFNKRRPNSQWSKPTYCLSYTDNTMPADALATLGTRASVGMVLPRKPEFSVSVIRRVKIRTSLVIYKIHFHFCRFPTLRSWCIKLWNILYSECSGCWWLSDARNQGISNNDTDLVMRGLCGCHSWSVDQL